MRFIKRLLICLFVLSGSAAAEDYPQLDLHSIPISDWLNGGEHADIPWYFRVRDPLLRIDQRMELFYSAAVDAKDLNKTGKDHELFLISRISTADGEWLNEASVVRHEVEELPKHFQAQFSMRVVVQPGDYLLWAVLYDRKTGKHNVAKRHVKVAELHGDPLPDLYSRMPPVEFPIINDAGNTAGVVSGQLYLPVHNNRPLHVELISMLNEPEQWTGRGRLVRVHNDDTIGALAALSQLQLAGGTLSITGLDLIRRQVIFNQRDFRSVNWASLMDAMKKAQTPDVSAVALQGAKNNGAFFRDFLGERLSSENTEGDPMRVIIVVTSAQLFESGADLRPLQVEGDCHCRVYYLRFRLSINDVFDQLEKFMKPLRPRVFNLIGARDLRKAIAEIVEDLGKF
jgi:hypothetical protein